MGRRGVGRPGLSVAVDPGHLQARPQAAHAVKVDVVAHMQDVLRLGAGRLGAGVEDARIGLADTEFAGAQPARKCRPRPTRCTSALPFDRATTG